MTKENRQKKVQELIETGIEVSEVKKQVAELAGVTTVTVARDIKELYPNLSGAENTPEPETPTVVEKPADNAETEPAAELEEIPTVVENSGGSLVIQVEVTEKGEFAKGQRSEYVVPSNEKDTLHAEIEKRAFKGGVKVSNPYVQKFDKRSWLNFKKNAKNLGFSYVKVLYKPVDF